MGCGPSAMSVASKPVNKQRYEASECHCESTTTEETTVAEGSSDLVPHFSPGNHSEEDGSSPIPEEPMVMQDLLPLPSRPAPAVQVFLPPVTVSPAPSSRRESFDAVENISEPESGSTCISRASTPSSEFHTKYADALVLCESPSSDSPPADGGLQSPRHRTVPRRKRLKRHGNKTTASTPSLDLDGTLASTSPRSFTSASKYCADSPLSECLRRSLTRAPSACATRFSKNLSSCTSPRSDCLSKVHSRYSLSRVVSKGTLSLHRVVHTRSVPSRPTAPPRILALFALTFSPTLSLLPPDIRALLLSYLSPYYFVPCNDTVAVNDNGTAVVQRWAPPEDGFAEADVLCEPLLKIAPGVPEGSAAAVCIRQCHAPQSYNTFGAVCEDKLPLMGSNHLSTSTVYAECSNTGMLSWWSGGTKTPAERVTIEKGTLYAINIDNTVVPPQITIEVHDAEGSILSTHTECIVCEPGTTIYAAAYLFEEGETVQLELPRVQTFQRCSAS